jgi:hypothetical protein
MSPFRVAAIDKDVSLRVLEMRDAPEMDKLGDAMNKTRPLAFVTGGSSGIGYEGLIAGEDRVAGSDQAAHEALERHLTRPEPVKAAAHAKFVRPD